MALIIGNQNSHELVVKDQPTLKLYQRYPTGLRIFYVEKFLTEDVIIYKYLTPLDRAGSDTMAPVSYVT